MLYSPVSSSSRYLTNDCMDTIARNRTKPLPRCIRRSILYEKSYKTAPALHPSQHFVRKIVQDRSRVATVAAFCTKNRTRPLPSRYRCSILYEKLYKPLPSRYRRSILYEKSYKTAPESLPSQHFVRKIVQNRTRIASIAAFCTKNRTKPLPSRYRRSILYEKSYKTAPAWHRRSILYEKSYKTAPAWHRRSILYEKSYKTAPESLPSQHFVRKIVQNRTRIASVAAFCTKNRTKPLPRGTIAAFCTKNRTKPHPRGIHRSTSRGCFKFRLPFAGPLTPF